MGELAQMCGCGHPSQAAVAGVAGEHGGAGGPDPMVGRKKRNHLEKLSPAWLLTGEGSQTWMPFWTEVSDAPSQTSLSPGLTGPWGQA